MAVGALAIVAALATAAVPPAPERWVEDHAGLISPAARAALDARLEGYERATGHQVVVWIGETLDGTPLADWAARTFAAWKLGRKGIDDGVAMFLLADDRAIDIEVGYGLEDRVTDAAASRIIREVMAPRLRAGDRDGAVTGGVDAVLAAIEGRPWPAGAVGPAPATAPDQPPSTLTLVLGGVGVLAVLILLVTHPQLALWLLWAIVAGGRRNGGGGFGGGGGGFSGGGGSSGGGGARGGW